MSAPGSARRTGSAALAAIAVLLLAATAAPALAHHSFAMFDHDHQIKISGTVTHFQWTNPHVYIDMDTDGSGRFRHYTIECANPGILDRAGWKWNMIKVGDRITAIIAPLRTGEAGGLLKQVTLADGRRFGNGGPAGKPNIQ
ncbi:MAG TPA: DUF6152 family protein [Steroidobacteraceae bacterium]|nr:DUF6152 family protein [Steroidobacteraceae bacterium]